MGDQKLENIRFDNVRRAGIMLAKPGIDKTWKNVTFGPNCQVKPEELVSPLPPSLLPRLPREVRGPAKP